MQVGAQVMLLKNLELDCGERMLVNGSRGVITKFVGKKVRPQVSLHPFPGHGRWAEELQTAA